MHVPGPQDLIRGDAAQSPDKVPIARETRVRIVVLAEGSNRVADIRVAELIEIFRRDAAPVAGAYEKFRVQQIVRERLKVAKHGRQAAWHKFETAAFIRAHLHREPAAMVVRERMERQTDLLELTDALGLARAQLRLGNGREQQRGEDSDNRDHHEQFDQREPTARRTMPECIHGVSLVLSD